MSASDIYNSGYSFARESNNRKQKILKIATLLFPIVIIIILAIGFISSLDSFQSKSEKVTQVFPKQATEEELAAQSRKLTESYADAGIPYIDPQGRFEITFITPYISDELLVVIRTQKDYDNVKSEADTIIANAQAKVKVSTVRYKNSF